MAASKQSASSSSKGLFRPKSLEPPRQGISQHDYNDYVENYRFYIDSLAVLRDEFWSSVKKPLERTFRRRDVYRFTKKGGLTGFSSEPVPTDNETSVVKSTQLVVDVAEKSLGPVETVPVKEPTAEELARRKQVKKAARRRQRLNRRLRDAKVAVTFSSNLVQVAKNNEALAKSRYTFGTIGVSPHSVVLPGRKKKQTGVSLTGKGKGSGGGPPPPSSQGPSGGSPPDDQDKKGPGGGSGKDRKPNRKERRRANYGPPKDSSVPEVGSSSGPPIVTVPVAAIEEVQKPAPFSFDGDSSDDDEKPAAKPEIWPPPLKSWQREGGEEAKKVFDLRLKGSLATEQSYQALEEWRLPRGADTSTRLAAAQKDLGVGLSGLGPSIKRKGGK